MTKNDDYSNTFTKYFINKTVRIAYKNENEYPRVATGVLIEGDESRIMIKTIKNEFILIRHDVISNIIEIKNEDKDGKNKY